MANIILLVSLVFCLMTVHSVAMHLWTEEEPTDICNVLRHSASYQFVHVFRYCDGKPVEEDTCKCVTLSGHLLDDIYENVCISTHSLAISK